MLSAVDPANTATATAAVQIFTIVASLNCRPPTGKVLSHTAIVARETVPRGSADAQKPEECAHRQRDNRTSCEADRCAAHECLVRVHRRRHGSSRAREKGPTSSPKRRCDHAGDEGAPAKREVKSEK